MIRLLIIVYCGNARITQKGKITFKLRYSSGRQQVSSRFKIPEIKKTEIRFSVLKMAFKLILPEFFGSPEVIKALKLKTANT